MNDLMILLKINVSCCRRLPTAIGRARLETMVSATEFGPRQNGVFQEVVPVEFHEYRRDEL